MSRVLLVLAVAVVGAAATTSAVAKSPWEPLASTGKQAVTVHIGASVRDREVVRDANIAVVPGEPVTLTLVSTSREFHTFTIPRLHVNVLVTPGSVGHPHATHVTFIARQVGMYAWFCELCPAVHHEGGMGGTVYALIGG
jgi:heme/copper-type cytochrome/quinol oxidase subunit 2